MTSKNPNQGKIPAGKPRDQSGQRKTENPEKLPRQGNRTDRADPSVPNDGQSNH